MTSLIPLDVSDDDVLDGSTDTEWLLPPWKDIPTQFRARSSSEPWCHFVSDWFFDGTDAARMVARPGVDRRLAFRHLRAVMRSHEPKHEHKIAGVAYLCSLWFEPLPATGRRP